MPTYSNDPKFARGLDERDPLAAFRQRFHIPKRSDDSELVYFCGNSLGLQPKSTGDFVKQELSDWAALGVEGHFRAAHPWMPYHELLTEQTSRLVGAKPIEVVVMNSLTVNLHLLMVSFYRPSKARHKILVEATPFPSDRYAVESQVRFHGYEPRNSVIELSPRGGESIIRTEDILDLIDREGDSIALIMIGGVNYYSGQAFDMGKISEAGHRAGSVVGFDLAHAAGNLVLRLHDWDIDFAVWCSYKYLNAGPGSTAGCFVHERHAEKSDLPRFNGWWGHNKESRFLMGSTYESLPGAEGWQLSNPAILPLAALRASMEVFDEAGMDALRKKSEMLTGYLEFLLDEHPEGFDVISPRDPVQRGAQLSIRVKNNAKEIYKSLNDGGFICDWREPDTIRVAPVPLYNTFGDVRTFATFFHQQMSDHHGK